MFGRLRNVPEKIRPVNPLPQNEMTNATGDAGCDGYTTLSRADRETGVRPPAGGGTRVDWPPKSDTEDYAP
jgi:hypothetical protein